MDLSRRFAARAPKCLRPPLKGSQRLIPCCKSGLATTKHHWAGGLLAKPPRWCFCLSKHQTPLHQQTSVPSPKSTRVAGWRCCKGAGQCRGNPYRPHPNSDDYLLRPFRAGRVYCNANQATAGLGSQGPSRRSRLQSPTGSWPVRPREM